MSRLCGKLSKPPPKMMKLVVKEKEADRLSRRRDDKDIKSMNRYEYRELKNFCYQYPYWQKQLEELNEDLGASSSGYDDIPASKSMDSAVERKALRMVQLNEKIAMIELAAQSVNRDLAFFILEYCTNPGMSFQRLDGIYGIPCSEATFYRHRREFFLALRDIRDGCRDSRTIRPMRPNWNRRTGQWRKEYKQ